MIAGNVLALAERGPVLVNAHNSHLQRTRSTMTMWDHPRLEWWGAGALVDARLGDRYAFVATALGTLRHQGVDVPPPDTVEGLLYPLGDESVVVDPAGLTAALAGPPAARVSPWFGYAPLDPAHLTGLDGLVFVRDVRPD
jgi:erythromycin esterase-like protein